MKPRTRFREVSLFVTVGSTRFDVLIQKIFSKQSIECLQALGFTKLVVQAGQSSYDNAQISALQQKHNLEIQVYDYKTSILDDIERADVVVGHAGAGTCLEVLRKKKRFLVVVNDQLMDNHQLELAEQLAEDRYVLKTTVHELLDDLIRLCDEATKLEEFPDQISSIFEEIFNEALMKVSSRL